MIRLIVSSFVLVASFTANADQLPDIDRCDLGTGTPFFVEPIEYNGVVSETDVRFYSPIRNIDSKGTIDRENEQSVAWQLYFDRGDDSEESKLVRDKCKPLAAQAKRQKVADRTDFILTYSENNLAENLRCYICYKN